MNKEELINYTYQLLDENNIKNIPVRVSKRLKSAWGQTVNCKNRVTGLFWVKEIVLSQMLVEAEETKQYNTIKHEIAHVLANLEHKESQGHNKIWREYALKLGCNSEVCS